MTRNEKLRMEAKTRRELRKKPRERNTLFPWEKESNYTYLLEYKNGMLYHGVRSCHCPIEEDTYYGSSKHTPNEIPNKKILTTHSTREEAALEEIRYHKEHDVRNNYRYYNRANATTTGFHMGATKWAWTKKDELRKRLKPMKQRFDVIIKKLHSRRCSCINCKSPIYISRINEHRCS